MLLEKYKKVLQSLNKDKFLTVRKACENEAVHYSSFYKALESHNLEVPTRKVFLVSSSKKDKLKKMYLEGQSINFITEELGMDHRTVTKYLGNMGIKLRVTRTYRTDLTCSHDYFNEIDTEEKAYWLGFLYADGCITSKNPYRLVLELANVDYNHLEKFKSALSSNHDIKTRKNRNISSISINSKEMVKSLISYGCMDNKTDDSYITESLFYNDLLKSSFLRGFCDGDGFIDKKRYRITITVKSYDIIKSLSDMITSLGIFNRIEVEDNYHRLQIGRKEDFFNLLNYMYKDSNIYLDRKYEIYKDRLALLNRNI